MLVLDVQTANSNPQMQDRRQPAVHQHLEVFAEREERQKGVHDEQDDGNRHQQRQREAGGWLLWSSPGR